MSTSFELISHVDEVMDKIRTEMKLRAEKAGMEGRNDIVDTLSGERSGKTGYTPSGKAYTMSAPGEPPAVRTGQLRQSIEYEVHKDRKGYYALVGSKLDYSKMLEFGTMDMQARPFIRPTLSKNVEKYKRIFRGGWD